MHTWVVSVLTHECIAIKWVECIAPMTAVVLVLECGIVYPAWLAVSLCIVIRRWGAFLCAPPKPGCSNIRIISTLFFRYLPCGACFTRRYFRPLFRLWPLFRACNISLIPAILFHLCRLFPYFSGKVGLESIALNSSRSAIRRKVGLDSNALKVAPVSYCLIAAYQAL